MRDTRTYQEIYNSTFKEIVENEDGTLNKDQVMRELSDFACMLEEVPRVYDRITGGRVSKPNTHASAVIERYEEYVQELALDCLREGLEEIRHECTCGAVARYTDEGMETPGG